MLKTILIDIPLQGKEFWNNEFQEMMSDLNIKFYYTNTNKKAQTVERVQRTIREKLERYFTHTRDHKWIDIIEKLVTSYNKTVHRTIKMRPIDVSYKDTPKILKLLYPPRIDKSVNFDIGDQVRVVKPRKVFQKRSRSMWQPDTYNIVAIKDTNPKTYKVDHGGKLQTPSYYAAELQKIT